MPLRRCSTGPLTFIATAAAERLTPDETPDILGAACTQVYAALESALEVHGLGTRDVVQLQHYTASQSWLAVRQEVRADFFGAPAPLASFGVPMPWGGRRWLAATAIAGRADRERRVVVSGEAHGMPAIATAVCVAPLVFVSGLLRRAEDAGRDAVAAAVDELAHVLGCAGAGVRPLYFEAFVTTEALGHRIRAALRDRFGADAALCISGAIEDPGFYFEIACVATTEAVRGEAGSAGAWHSRSETLSATSFRLALHDSLQAPARDCAAAVTAALSGRAETGAGTARQELVRLTAYVPHGVDWERVQVLLEQAFGAPISVVPACQRDVTGIALSGVVSVG